MQTPANGFASSAKVTIDELAEWPDSFSIRLNTGQSRPDVGEFPAAAESNPNRRTWLGNSVRIAPYMGWGLAGPLTCNRRDTLCCGE